MRCDSRHDELSENMAIHSLFRTFTLEKKWKRQKVISTKRNKLHNYTPTGYPG